MIGMVFTVTEHAYGEQVATPELPARHPSKLGELGYSGWEQQSVETHNRGVTIVWRSPVVLEQEADHGQR